jgi:hypothetical protein
VVELVETDRVDDVEAGLRENAAVAPLGSPLSLRLTLPEKPPLGEMSRV